MSEQGELVGGQPTCFGELALSGRWKAIAIVCCKEEFLLSVNGMPEAGGYANVWRRQERQSTPIPRA
jgi:hypothetical protein